LGRLENTGRPPVTGGWDARTTEDISGGWEDRTGEYDI